MSITVNGKRTFENRDIRRFVQSRPHRPSGTGQLPVRIWRSGRGLVSGFSPNPFKQQSELLDDHTRLELVQKAVAGYSRFRASDFEFSLPRPSYTIHTLQALSAAYPEREFYLIIGADNWQAFQKWKSPEIILEQYHLLIYPRQGYTLDESSLPSRVKAVHSPLLEISSTFIRESLAQGKDIRYFLHPEVHRIIQERKLYQQF